MGISAGVLLVGSQCHGVQATSCTRDKAAMVGGRSVSVCWQPKVIRHLTIGLNLGLKAPLFLQQAIKSQYCSISAANEDAFDSLPTDSAGGKICQNMVPQGEKKQWAWSSDAANTPLNTLRSLGRLP